MALVMAFVEPFGTLWFIHMLPIFFIVAKLARRLPMPVVLGVAAALEIAHVDTGLFVVDQFCARLVYFLAGYYACRHVFQLAAWAQGNVRLALAGLGACGLVLEAGAVALGISALPVVSLALGMAGAMAVVAASALMAGRDVFAPLRYCGRNTLIIYLAFFLFMATSRVAAGQARRHRGRRLAVAAGDADRGGRPAAAEPGGQEHPGALPVRAAGVDAAGARPPGTAAGGVTLGPVRPVPPRDCASGASGAMIRVNIKTRIV